jgi:catechol 2,3-dioxygenase-like lactoylglutathione lyase family enzyme
MPTPGTEGGTETPVVVTLHHVQLAMPGGGEDEARRFYSGILGLAEVPKPSNLAARGGCWFQLGDRELHLRVEQPFVAARKAHPALLVKDLYGVRQRFEHSGVRTREDEPLLGYRRFYADDPFGNRLEFLEAQPSTG